MAGTPTQIRIGGGGRVKSRGPGLGVPLKGGGGKEMKKAKSKIIKPDSEQNSMNNVMKRNKKTMRKLKTKNSKLSSKSSKSNQPSSSKGKRKGKFNAPKGGSKGIRARLAKGGKGKGKKGRKGKKKQQDIEQPEEPQEIPEIDPYEVLKQTAQTNHSALIRMFLHKLGDYPVNDHLGNFGDQLQSSMINFSRDMILPQLMTLDNVDRMKTIINDRKLIYLLRQSFVRWLLIHKQQLKLLFKKKGEADAKNKVKYDIVVTKNHIIQKLGSTLNSNDNDIKDIISKLPLQTKMKYFHYLKSDIKNPFLAQLMTPIPKNILSNTKCNVPSLSGKMPDMEDKKDNLDGLLPDAPLPADDPPDAMLEPEKQPGLLCFFILFFESIHPCTQIGYEPTY